MATITAPSFTSDIKSQFEQIKALSFHLRKESVQKRIERLNALRKWIHANRPKIHEAVFNDFQKPSVEVDGTEVFHVLNEIKHAVSHLHDWTAPKKIDAPFTMLGTRSKIVYEPKGACLIISPWNYPFSLAVGPLVSALAAGNSVILKPSELTPHVSKLISKMVSEVFTDGSVKVFEGGVETAQALLSLPFDHIFFTGSPQIGKIVMKAAAEHLTSVTLELGGKSPTVVTASANLKDAAKRISVAKFINNGQTCIAPDYILVDAKVEKQFLALLVEEIKTMFSEGGDFENSKSYCRIVNDRHFNRLDGLLKEAVESGANIVFGGSLNSNDRFFHPIVLTQVPLQSRILEEEIFGPILPVMTYTDLSWAIDFIQTKPKPLALYVYSNKKTETDRIITEVSSGAVAINDSAIHFLHHNLPFGGVNNSGIGKSHGHYGFLAFSNEKPVLKQKSGFTSIQLFYPPYTHTSKKIMDWFLKLF